MKPVYLLRMLFVVLASSFLLSCVSVKNDEPRATRSLVSAKSYSHPTKTSSAEDIQICRNAVAKEEVDDCMAEKGWTVNIKRFD